MCTFAISIFIFISAADARKPSGGSAAALDGQWYHNGKPTRILVAPDNRSITIINEFGQRNDGYAATNRDLVIPSLGISGHVNKTGQRISWINGTEWTRERKGPGPNFDIKLSGRWFHNGKATSIDVTPDGRNFAITNEHGQRSSGYINPNGKLVIPSLGVTGHMSQNGQRISWSNGTEWTRPRLF
jgi:hypothetical protein